MAEPKTKQTKASVAGFIATVNNEQRHKDAKVVLALMKKFTGDRRRCRARASSASAPTSA